jgi:hypothetical protein
LFRLASCREALAISLLTPPVGGVAQSVTRVGSFTFNEHALADSAAVHPISLDISNVSWRLPPAGMLRQQAPAALTHAWLSRYLGAADLSCTTATPR